MRVSGALLLLLVIAMAVVVVLQSRDLGAKREAVAVIATQLREEGVAGTRFDRDRALEIILVLDGLAADPEAIGNHTDDLATIAETAAGWAAGAPSPSPELHAAVAIRKAAAELRSHAVQPSTRTLDTARRELDRARDALTTQAAGDGTLAPSGLVTEGVRDRLGNLEAAQKERALEIDEDSGQ